MDGEDVSISGVGDGDTASLSGVVGDIVGAFDGMSVDLLLGNEVRMLDVSVE